MAQFSLILLGPVHIASSVAAMGTGLNTYLNDKSTVQQEQIVRTRVVSYRRIHRVRLIRNGRPVSHSASDCASTYMQLHKLFIRYMHTDRDMHLLSDVFSRALHNQ